MAITIELDDFLDGEEKALIGRNNGENVKKKLLRKYASFEELEEKNDKITISIPERVISINKSFFLGLFETPIQRLKKEGFLQKYEISASAYIRQKVESHVEAALLSASQGDILNGVLSSSK